jgi:hypothetical protein
MAFFKGCYRRADDRTFPIFVLLFFAIGLICPAIRSYCFAITGILMIFWFLACICDFTEPDRVNENRTTITVVGLFRFAYVFTILSIVLLAFPMTLGEAALSIHDGKIAGISVFRGCLKQPPANLDPKAQRTIDALGTSLIPLCPDGKNSADADAKKQDEKEAGTASAPAASGVAETSDPAPAGTLMDANTSYAWLISVGGVSGEIVNRARSGAGQESNPQAQEARTGKGKPDGSEVAAVRVQDGLVIPFYVILVSIMGAAVSLSRRLPEYQRQAAIDDLQTDHLTLAVAKERVVFELMQLVSAPLIVVAAFAAVTPTSPGVAIVLAFATGFASESILCLIRGVTDGLKPASASKQSRPETVESGKILVTVTDVNGKPLKDAAISVEGYPKLDKTTNESGKAMLPGVPVGSLIVKVSLDGKSETRTITVKSGATHEETFKL